MACGRPGYDRQGGDGHKKYHRSVEVNLVALDSHHIEPREKMTGGGYVKENGVSLCDDPAKKAFCHILAEEYLKNGTGQSGYSPEELYKKIDSSFEKAYYASQKLI